MGWNSRKLSERVKTIQWALPLVIILFVVVYQTWFVDFIHDAVSEEAHYFVELFLYGAMGPLVTFFVLGWIRQWLLDKENAEEMVRVQEQRLALLRVEEGKRVAQHLHREVLPNLAYIANKMDHTLNKHLGGDPQPIQAKELISGLSGTLRDTIGELREKINLLRRGAPLMGYKPDEDLMVSLDEKAKEFEHLLNLHVALKVEGDVKELSYELQSSLWRIINEALNNTALHANARNVLIQLNLRELPAIILSIRDDGKGFNEAQWRNKPIGLGLVHIAEEADKWNGSFDVQSDLGSGTQLDICLYQQSKEDE
jgi:signal transduction histidine kinase